MKLAIFGAIEQQLGNPVRVFMPVGAIEMDTSIESSKTTLHIVHVKNSISYNSTDTIPDTPEGFRTSKKRFTHMIAEAFYGDLRREFLKLMMNIQEKVYLDQADRESFDRILRLMDGDEVK